MAPSLRSNLPLVVLVSLLLIASLPIVNAASVSASEKTFTSFLQECSSCTSSSQCSTNKCWGTSSFNLKCVYDTAASRAKCFPTATPSPTPSKPASLLPECSRCTSSSQCSTNKCWGTSSSNLKCVFDTSASRAKCFPTPTPSPTPSKAAALLPECSRCTSSSQCATKKCWGTSSSNLKCVFDTSASRAKCFPPATPTPSPTPTKAASLLPECSSCTSSSQCATKKCWGTSSSNLKCVYDTAASRAKCFPPATQTPSPTPSKAAALLPECSRCTSSSQCATKKCWGTSSSNLKCVFDTAASRAKCFPTVTPTPSPTPSKAATLLPECSRCTSSSQCSTNKCWGTSSSNLRCVFDTPASREKCFPSPTPSSTTSATPSPTPTLPAALLPECSACKTNSQCATKKCWGTSSSNLKCVFDTPASRSKCFPSPTPASTPTATPTSTPTPSPAATRSPTPRPRSRECRKCRSDANCISNNCERGRCTLGTPASTRKCFGRKLCATCSEDIECKSGRCFNKKCVGASRRSVLRCFPLKKECDRCKTSDQCASKKCMKLAGRRRCVLPTAASVAKCFGRPECAKCRRHRQCQTRICESGRCVFNTPASRNKCNGVLAEECESCRLGSQCQSGKCWGGKCVFDTTASKNKCFPHLA